MVDVQMMKYNFDSKAEVLLEWIWSPDTYFACEETTKTAKLNFATILLSQSTTLWHRTTGHYDMYMDAIQEAH